MADGGVKGAGHDIRTYDADGIEVKYDATFAASWEGLVMAADMQSKRLGDAARFMATVEYYQRVCPNMDDVVAALGEASADGEVSGSDAMQFVARVIKEGTPKN